jgi:hypothetical protein
MRSTGEGNDGDGDPSGDDSPEVAVGPFGLPAFPVPATAADAIAAVRALAQTDFRGEEDDALLGLFDGLETLDRVFHSARFGMLAELDARQLTDRRLGHVTANEGWRHGTDPKRVRADLATAKTLRNHQPKLAASLADGGVAVDRVREVCRQVNDRNRDALHAAQQSLIDLCNARSTFRQFTRDVEQLARLADSDGAEPPLPRNHARLERSGDQVTATIDLYGSAAIGFAQRVQAEADRLFRVYRREHGDCPDVEIPPRSALLAEAFMNLIEHGAAQQYAGKAQPAADIAIIVDVDQHTLGDLFEDGTLLPGKGHGRIDWSKVAVDIDGSRLRYASHEWEMLTCDASYEWVIRGAGGHPIACQHGERHASREQRRNLAFRDGRCCYPGCDAPATWCDAHHVQHHSDDGPTDICNLALLCRRHHGVIHRTGWTMQPNLAPKPGEGFFTITSPTGHVLHTQHRRPPAPV